jgi:hypothetical protein
MDPLTASVTIILGKYALDKGAELAKAVGPKALEAAKEMFTTTLGRLRRDPAGEVIADEFEKAPQVYQKPLEQKLAAALEADPAFAARLKELFSQYEQATKDHAAATGTTYEATLTGTGSIAQGEGASATTATEGGTAIGSVGGDVNIGSKDKDKA